MDGFLLTASTIAALGLSIFWLSFTAAMGWHAGRRQAAKCFGPVTVSHVHRDALQTSAADLLKTELSCCRSAFGITEGRRSR